MSHGTDATVECPLCGATFDPSVSGGWCTDSECGAWRATLAASGGRRLVTDGGTTEDTHAERGDEESPDVAEVWPDGDGESDDADADPPESTADDAETDGEANAEISDDTDDATGEDAETIACPACETEIAVGDNFCRACGADVSGIDDTGELANCPSCEAAVEPEDRFCRECGEHLVAHRPGTEEAPATGGGPAGSPQGAPAGGTGGKPTSGGKPVGTGAGTANAGQSGAVNAETVKHGGSAGNAALSDREDADEPEETGPRLSLVARNREVSVGDGDVVGKEIRSIIMDTGGDEEDAVRVHREHVRFEYEDGGFYLVDLGQNATVVNGEELEQGDRVPVEPGDRIDLSGVARIGVRQG